MKLIREVKVSQLKFNTLITWYHSNVLIKGVAMKRLNICNNNNKTI